jgi:hypothetical protein
MSNNQLIAFAPSTRKNKKLMMTIIQNKQFKTIHFGSDKSQTYVEGASKQKRDNYIKRHQVNENWNQVNPGSASRFILWGDSTNLETNLKSFLRRFKIKDRR